MKRIEVSNKIYYIGVNDRRKTLFENIWPLPNGVSYNSYLIADQKTALIDTLEFGSKDDYLDTIEEILEGRKLDYLVVNHMEPDHSSMISTLLKFYPDLKVIGNNKTFKMLDSYYKLKPENFLEVIDGQELELGVNKLKFVMTPWVHWPETMMSYEINHKILFSCDAFGTFGALDGAIFDDEINFSYYEDEALRYFSNIVGKYSNMVQKALTKLHGFELNTVCPSHGPVWRSDPNKIVSLYDKWSKFESEEGVVIAFASMYGNTEKMADFVARLIAEKGVKNIRIFDVSKTHPSFIISEIWKYRSVLLGSSAYNATMHPMMEHLCSELEIINPKMKKFGLFGSFSWSGGGVKYLKAFADKMEWSLVSDPVELIGVPDLKKMESFYELSDKII